jgi:hypothetical protein
MQLTGKAKAKFEEWLCRWLQNENSKGSLTPQAFSFDMIPLPMQWGTYQDWADSVGYIFNVYCNASGYLYEFHRNVSGGGTHLYDSGFEADTPSGAWETRQEARNAAIEKLNELINGDTAQGNFFVVE